MDDASGAVSFNPCNMDSIRKINHTKKITDNFGIQNPTSKSPVSKLLWADGGGGGGADSESETTTLLSTGTGGSCSSSEGLASSIARTSSGL